ncbi:MAG: aminopeptidase P family N-terminal domain-containing protein, partial [Limibacillus sp.]
MPDVALNFSREEYAERLAKTRREMEHRGIELLIVSDPSNMAWLTGYDGWSFYVHQGVLVSMDSAPVWWGRAMDAVGAGLTTYLPDDNIIGYDDTYVQNPEKHPMTELSGHLAARGLEKARIGLEMDNYYFTASAYMALTKAMPGAQFSDATGL